MASVIPMLPLDSVVLQVCDSLDQAREWEAAFRLVLSEEMWDVIIPRRMRDEIIASFEPWQLQPIESNPVVTIPRSRPIPPVVVTLDRIEPIPFNEPSRAEAERMVADLGRMMDQCLLSAFRAVTEGDPVPVPAPEQPAYETDRAKLKRRGIRQLMYEHTSPAGMVWAHDSMGRVYHVGQTMATVKTSNDEEEFWRATDRYRQHDGHACPCPMCQVRWNDHGQRIDRFASLRVEWW